MDTNRDGMFGSDLQGSHMHMPSGCEVESATLHVPVGESTLPTPERSGVMAKLDSLKSEASMKLHDVQRAVSDRSALVKSTVTRSVADAKSSMTRSISTAKTSMRDTTNNTMTQMQDSMRVSPMKWAGIAAGAGFGLGMIGRIIHWRNQHQRSMPSLVVIERSC